MVKWSMLALCGLSLMSAARAAPGQSCIRAGGGLSHMVARVEHPADCCTGHMQCAQFLSTSIVARPAGRERT